VTALAFEVTGARPEPHAAAPTLVLRLQVAETSGRRVQALVLRCQIRIEPGRRRYDTGEEERLFDLFGAPPGWAESLRPFPWTHVSTTVPPFDGTVEVDVPVELTYDLEVAGTRYFHALGGGDVPLLLLFSGTAFTDGATGFTAEPIAWDREASFRLPVAVWRATMDHYFPNSGWLRLGRDTLDALQRFKSERALPTWDHAVEALLQLAREGAP
jgi:hypothetical protein